MKGLGYTRYVAQGGDWGAGVVEAMGRQAPAGLLGIHTNLPAARPQAVGYGLTDSPAGLSGCARVARIPRWDMRKVRHTLARATRPRLPSAACHGSAVAGVHTDEATEATCRKPTDCWPPQRSSSRRTHDDDR